MLIRNTKKYPFDKKFFFIVLILLGIGLITLVSTSLSVYAESSSQFWGMMIRHVGLGAFGGVGAMFLFSRIHYAFWQKVSPYVYILGIILTFLVFSPLGESHGGAVRWLNLGFISFQPAELLKFSTILFVAAWFAKFQDSIKSIKYGPLALGGILLLPLVALGLQPDTSTLLLIATVSGIIYFLRGAAWKHVLISLGLGVILFTAYAYLNPHIIERFQTFRDPSRDPLGSSFQVNQSEIAIGAGKLFGRGLGQSVHKFGGLIPEPYSDSIFAIYAEEFGFIGSLILLSLFTLFTFFGFRIARYAPSAFAQNLVLGIILLIVIQVLLNIAAISRVIPLSGFPLIFMSNGGTALLVTLAEIGIILNISRYSRVPVKIIKKRI